MAQRRGLGAGSRRLASGPGNLTRALAITRRENGADLTTGPITIEPGDQATRRVAAGPRLGITRATERVLRFWIAGNPHVSRHR
jgi:DNA-3-methyladenine glycosylase